MPQHDVTFEVPARTLGKSDVTFRIRQDGSVLGTLTVSKGSIVWFPHKTSYGLKMGWSRLDQMMKEHARRTEKR